VRVAAPPLAHQVPPSKGDLNHDGKPIRRRWYVAVRAADFRRVLLVMLAAVWVFGGGTSRKDSVPVTPSNDTRPHRGHARDIVDERYARGELSTRSTGNGCRRSKNDDSSSGQPPRALCLGGLRLAGAIVDGVGRRPK
jgi:hypothetical protein